MAAQDYTALVQQLYVTYFGRPADYFGLDSFTKQLDALGAPKTLDELNAAVQASTADSALSKLVNSFSSSAESTNLYGSDNSQVGVSKFVEAIYLNLLGRAPDVEGWAFWTNAITSGNLTRANAAMAIATGALGNTTAQGLLDAATVTNKVTIAGNFTTALDTVAEINGYAGDTAAASARGLLAAVDSTTVPAAYQATVEATIGTIVSGSIPSTSTTLTDAVQTLVGTNGNDVFTAQVGSDDTLNDLDSIDGGAGSDTLNVLAIGAITDLPSGVTIKNVETLSIRGSGAVSYDTANNAGVTGLTKIAVTQAAAVAIVADATTAVDVAGATGTIAIDGGSTQTVKATGAAAITLGATTGAAGAIAVTATAQTAAIAIDGGTSVSVTSTSAGATGGDITIGGTTAPTGAVAVVSTGKVADTANFALGDIEVTGGSTVSVIQTATSNGDFAKTDTSAAVITQGDITITGTSKTTSVTVQQTEAVAVKNGATAAGTYETTVVTFKALTTGQTVIVDGLTFTAAKALTAAEVAAAFASIAASGVQGSGVSGNGTYTGALSANFASGVASGATVTFTATAKGNATDIDVDNGTGTAPTVVTTTGIASVTGAVGHVGVVAGVVLIDDNSNNKLATVSIDGYGAGSTVTSDVLTSLSLAHSAEDIQVVNTAATTLGLTVNGIDGAVDLGAVYTNLNITTATEDSVATLNAAGVKALTVAGTNDVDLSGSTLTALVSVKVTGAAGVTVNASGANVTSVDTSGTTGDNTITVDATKATFTGGAGVDTVTLSAAAPTKAVSLGAGDDVLKLAATTTSSAANLSGGDGTDTIVFATGADAETASGDAAFEGKISGFEKVGITTFGGADVAVDLSNLDGINYVVVSGGTADVLELNNAAANFTLELAGDTSGATSIDVVLADATGAADSINVVLNTDGDIDFGTVNAAGVETIKLTANDTDDETIETQTIDLVSTTVKSIVITGNSNLTLANTGDVKLASVDGSAMTGVLTATTNGTLAETIKGGSAADVLTAAGNGDTLIGGAGNDTLIATGNLAKLTGGAGTDTFNVSDATSNVNSYATITDLSVGDIIAFGAGTTFNASKVVLEDTAVFQDYANAAIAETAMGAISWFQIGGNTYVIDNVSGGTTFDNGNDLIVKITGSVDLSHASFSASAHTLVLVG